MNMPKWSDLRRVPPGCVMVPTKKGQEWVPQKFLRVKVEEAVGRGVSYPDALASAIAAWFEKR